MALYLSMGMFAGIVVSAVLGTEWALVATGAYLALTIAFSVGAAYERREEDES